MEPMYVIIWFSKWTFIFHFFLVIKVVEDSLSCGDFITYSSFKLNLLIAYNILYLYYTKNSWYYHKFDITLKTSCSKAKSCHIMMSHDIVVLSYWLIFSIIQLVQDIVNAICDDDNIKAISFVGSNVVSDLILVCSL